MTVCGTSSFIGIWWNKLQTDGMFFVYIISEIISFQNLIKKIWAIFDKERATIFEKNTWELIAKGTFEDCTLNINLVIREANEDIRESCLRTNESNKKLWLDDLEV